MYTLAKHTYSKTLKTGLKAYKYTPNCAVQGDMGWPLPVKQQSTTITLYWYRLMTMDTNRINKQVFTWTWSRASIRNKNWVYRVSNFYRELKMDSMMDIDTCKQNSANDMEIMLSEYYEGDWLKG